MAEEVTSGGTGRFGGAHPLSGDAGLMSVRRDSSPTLYRPCVGGRRDAREFEFPPPGCIGIYTSSFPGSARERAVWQAPPAVNDFIKEVGRNRGRASTAVRSRAEVEPGNECANLQNREPPDLFWWDQVHVFLAAARPVDSQAMPSVARDPKPWCVELSLHPDTTNMKLVARCREPKLNVGQVLQPASQSFC
jgi:hypothetical protein